MSARDLSQSVALVTGASRGIGAATARTLAARGATVYACARSAPELDALTRDPRIKACPLDLRSGQALDALIARIQDEHGHLDLLVQNASILGPIGPITGMDDDAWRQVIEINLNALFALTRRAIPLLRAAPTPPLVLNLSSSVGRKARAGWGAYCVSKFAVEGLTALLADELRDPPIIVCSLNPGGTATAMRAAAYPDEDPATLPTPERVARTICALSACLTPAQSGARYSSRDLFVIADADDAAWPADASRFPTDA